MNFFVRTMIVIPVFLVGMSNADAQSNVGKDMQALPKAERPAGTALDLGPATSNEKKADIGPKAGIASVRLSRSLLREITVPAIGLSRTDIRDLPRPKG
jgi:hypothetical protein